MKNLKDYILETYKGWPIYFEYSYEYDHLCELFNNDIPKDFLNQIKEGDFKDFVLENLNTHDSLMLQNKIKKEFKDIYKYIDFEDISNKSEDDNKIAFIIYCKNSEEANKLYNDKELKNLIEFYGYYISQLEEQRVLICPKYSKYADNLVYKKNHGQLYHFTTLDKEDDILKHGLKVMNSNYRKFPERIYFYSEYRDLRKIEGIKKIVDKVVGPFRLKRHGLLILKVDMSKHDTPFYRDDCMDDKNSVFTYTSIPKELIKKINIKYDELS